MSNESFGDSLAEVQMNDSDLVNSMGSPMSEASPTPRVYMRRWLVLAAFVLVNFSNGTLWISYASVADITAIYYQTDDMFVNMLALIFPIIAAICGVLVSTLLLKINLRLNMTLCALGNLLGAVLRIISSIPHVSINTTVRLVLVMGGQLVAAVAQPFIMFSSTTLAVEWFAENQRALANTIASMANPLGIMISNLISPAIAKAENDIFTLNCVYGGPALLCFVLVIIGITRSKPPTPPTFTRTTAVQSQGDAFTSIRDSLSICFRSKHFLLLVWGFSVGMGMFTSISTFLQQMLCPSGYSNTFAGAVGAVLIGAGLIMSGIVSAIVDYKGVFNEAIKICFSLSAIAFIIFNVVMEMRNLQGVILFSIAMYGAFVFACYPVALELGAEITYPASETVSTGLLIQGGQIMSVVMILIIQFAAVNMTNAPYSVCAKNSPPQSFRIPGYILLGLEVATCIPMLLVFHGEYRRRRAENDMAQNDGTETVSVVSDG